MSDLRLDSPSFHRNIDPVLSLFKELLKETSLTWLEIGSGSGQHVERFGREFPNYQFQPTDIEQENINSINAWVESAGLLNVEKARSLDVTRQTWLVDSETGYDIISAFNVIHIAPWSVTEGIFNAASIAGSDKCRIFLYGPFKIDGKQTSESNARFEEWLKGKDASFGVRDIADVSQVAEASGFSLSKMHEMPANNFMMEFVRTEN